MSYGLRGALISAQLELVDLRAQTFKIVDRAVVEVPCYSQGIRGVEHQQRSFRARRLSPDVRHPTVGFGLVLKRVEGSLCTVVDVVSQRLGVQGKNPFGVSLNYDRGQPPDQPKNEN